jgi:hypothetical protein
MDATRSAHRPWLAQKAPTPTNMAVEADQEKARVFPISRRREPLFRIEVNLNVGTGMLAPAGANNPNMIAGDSAKASPRVATDSFHHAVRRQRIPWRCGCRRRHRRRLVVSRFAAVERAFRRRAANHQTSLPGEGIGVLNPGIDAVAAGRRMNAGAIRK